MRRGWTIIEMTCVIAILTLLVSILLPGLRHTNREAMHLHTGSNLRQLARAATLYSVERSGMFPPGLLHGLNNDAQSGDVRAWDWWKRPDGTVQPGPVWALTDTTDPRGILQCPLAQDQHAGWNGDPVTGYNYNVAFIAAEAASPWTAQPGMGAWDLVIEKPNLGGLGWLTRAQCRRAGTTALFGLGGRLGGVNKFMRSPVNIGGMETAYAGGQAFPDGVTHVAWVDGHIARRRHPFRGQLWDDLPNWMTSQLEWPRNGFLSDDARAYDPR